MKTRLHSLFTAVALSAAFALGLQAAPQVGQPAPDFSLTDINGKTVSLSSLKGKTVVLEWVNPECPFVVKHYEKSGNLPATQKAATEAGVVWLSINSGHAGAQGDLNNERLAEWMKKNAYAGTAYMRDQDGKVGKLYDARTTPHMFVVDPAGTLVYAGGIDDIRSSKPDDIAKATNFVNAALADLKAGKPVTKSTSTPYGCSVKYGK